MNNRCRLADEIKWLYSYSPSREARPCCGRVNRGVAILGNTLYMGTIDAHWSRSTRNRRAALGQGGRRPGAGYAMTHAPLIVKDKVIVGTAGGEYGIRGFIAAYRCGDRQGSLALLHHSRVRASRATKPGRAIRGSTAARRSG